MEIVLSVWLGIVSLVLIVVSIQLIRVSKLSHKQGKMHSGKYC